MRYSPFHWQSLSHISPPRGSRNPAIGTAPNERGGDHGDGTPSHRRHAPRQTQLRHTASRHQITWHTTALPSKKQKSAHANIKIATLNIRGCNTTTANGPNNKWCDLNQVLRDTKTGIIALQETHLTDE